MRERLVSLRVQYDRDTDSGYIIFEEVGPHDSAYQRPVFLGDMHPGPIIFDFDSSHRLLRMEVLCFSEIIPNSIMQQLLVIQNDIQPESVVKGQSRGFEFDQYVKLVVNHDEDVDIGIVILGTHDSNSTTRRIPVDRNDHSGQIVLVFDEADKLLSLEINSFSEAAPIGFIHEVCRNRSTG